VGTRKEELLRRSRKATRSQDDYVLKNRKEGGKGKKRNIRRTRQMLGGDLPYAKETKPQLKATLGIDPWREEGDSEIKMDLEKGKGKGSPDFL